MWQLSHTFSASFELCLHSKSTENIFISFSEMKLNNFKVWFSKKENVFNWLAINDERGLCLNDVTWEVKINKILNICNKFK